MLGCFYDVDVHVDHFPGRNSGELALIVLLPISRADRTHKVVSLGILNNLHGNPQAMGLPRQHRITQ